MDLTQAEADELLQMAKFYRGSERYIFPSAGGKLAVPLVSEDGREKFLLDVYQSCIQLEKYTYQSRTRRTIILARVDINGSPHRNPDGEMVESSHIHLYREGFEDKWAFPLPSEFDLSRDGRHLLQTFMDFCHIIEKPDIEASVL